MHDVLRYLEDHPRLNKVTKLIPKKKNFSANYKIFDNISIFTAMSYTTKIETVVFWWQLLWCHISFLFTILASFFSHDI